MRLQNKNITASLLSTTTLISLIALLPTTINAFASSQAAILVVEASHGGAGQDLTNTTITVPLTAAYTNHSALDEVSTLYLVDSIGVTLKSITCDAFSNSNGTGFIGPNFNSSEPRYLSTNTVQVGSIVCVSSDISFAPPSQPPGGPRPLTTSSSSSNLTKTISKSGGAGATSTLVKTTSAGGGGGGTSTQQSTITSVVSGEPSSGASASAGGGATATSSGAPGLSSDNANAANGLSLGSEFFGGLALFGFGLAFVL